MAEKKNSQPWPVDEDDQEDADTLNEDANNLEEEGRSHQKYISLMVVQIDTQHVPDEQIGLNNSQTLKRDVMDQQDPEDHRLLAKL